MTSARWLTCLALCFVDVHVRAADAIFDAHDHRTTFTLGPARFVLAKGALAVVEGRGLRLVQGRALVLAGTKVTTPFGTIACEGACEAILNRTYDEFTIETLTTGWTLTRTGDIERALPAATLTRVGGIATDGKAFVTAPAALAWAPLIAEWAKLYPDGAPKFTERAHAFRADWETTVATISDRDQNRALAMIEAKSAADARAAARARAEAAETAELRRLFREKNYVE